MALTDSELQQSLVGARARKADREAQYAGNYDTGKPGLGEIDRSIGKGADLLANVGRGAVNVFGSTISGVGQELAAIGDTNPDDSILNKAGQYVKDLGNKIDVNPKFAEDTTTKIASGLGSAGGFIAGTVAAGLAGTAVAPGAGTVTGLVAGGGMGIAAMMDEMVQDFKRTTGRAPEGEELDKLAQMSLLGASEVAPIGRGLKIAQGLNIMGKPLKKIAEGTVTKNVAKQMAYRGIEQGVEEAVQEGGLGIAKNYAAKEFVEYDKDRELIAGLSDDVTVGGATGFIMGAALGALGVRARTKGAQVLEEAKKNIIEEDKKVYDEDVKDYEKEVKDSQKDGNETIQANYADVDTDITNKPAQADPSQLSFPFDEANQGISITETPFDEEVTLDENNLPVDTTSFESMWDEDNVIDIKAPSQNVEEVTNELRRSGFEVTYEAGIKLQDYLITPIAERKATSEGAKVAKDISVAKQTIAEAQGSISNALDTFVSEEDIVSNEQKKVKKVQESSKQIKEDAVAFLEEQNKELTLPKRIKKQKGKVLTKEQNKEKQTSIKIAADKVKVKKLTKKVEQLAQKGKRGTEAAKVIGELAKVQSKHSKRTTRQIYNSITKYYDGIYESSTAKKEVAALKKRGGKKQVVKDAAGRIATRKEQQRVDAAAGKDLTGMDIFLNETLDTIDLIDKDAFAIWNKKTAKQGGTTLAQLKAYATAQGIKFTKRARSKATIIKRLQAKKTRDTIPPVQKVITAAKLADQIASGQATNPDQAEIAIENIKDSLVLSLKDKGWSTRKSVEYVNNAIFNKQEYVDKRTLENKSAALAESLESKGVHVSGKLTNNNLLPVDKNGDIALIDLPLIPERVEEAYKWLESVLPRFANGTLNKKYTRVVHTMDIRDLRSLSSAMAQYGVKAWASKIKVVTDTQGNQKQVINLKITNNTKVGPKQVHPMATVKGLKIPTFAVSYATLEKELSKGKNAPQAAGAELDAQAAQQEAQQEAQQFENPADFLGEDIPGAALISPNTEGERPLVTTPAFDAEQENLLDEQGKPPSPFPNEGATPRNESGLETSQAEQDIQEAADLDLSDDGVTKLLEDIESEDGTILSISKDKDMLASKKEISNNLKFKISKKINNIQKKFADRNIDIQLRWDFNREQFSDSLYRQLSTIYYNSGEAGLRTVKGALSPRGKGKDVVTIFGNNIKSIEELEKTLLHEIVGHYSMERLMGKLSWNRLLDQILKSKEFSKEVDLLRERYKDTVNSSDYIIAREVIAKQAESMKNDKAPGWFNQVITRIRHALRKLGLIEVSKSDVAALLVKAEKQLRTDTFENNRQGRDPNLFPTVGDFANEPATLSLKEGVRKAIRAAIPRSLDVQKEVLELTDVVSGLPQNIMDQVQGPWARRNIEHWNKIAKMKPFVWYSPLKALAQERAFRAVRGQTLGTKSTFDEYSRTVYETYKNLDTDQKSLVMDYYSTKAQDINDLKYNSIPEDIRTVMQESKNVIRKLGVDLVDRGILSKEVQEENDDAYIPRQFIMWMMEDPKVVAQFGSGNRISAMNYIKQKNMDMTSSQLEYLGLVDDPAILVAQTIATVGRDVALFDMLTGINEMKTQKGEDPWIFPGSKFNESIPIPWNLDKEGKVQNGQIAQELDYLADATRIFKKHTKYDSEANQIERTKRDKYLREKLAEIAPGLENLNIKDYKFVEESKRNGKIAGKWLRKEIFNDIKSTSFAFSPENLSQIEKVAKAITNSTRWWKSSKTVWNPPTHVRNAVGNFINLDISTDTSSIKLTKMVIDEFGNYLKARSEGKTFAEMDSPWWQIADQMGITESTFTAQEAKQALNEWQNFQKSGNWMDGIPNQAMKKWMQGNFPVMSTGFMKILDKMAGTYQFSESLFKVVKLRDNIQRYEKRFGKLDTSTPEGLANAQAIYAMAVDNAQTWIFDYSNVHQAVRFLRSAPIGAPFISFAYLALPRMMESIAKHPQKFIKYAMLPYAVGSIAAMTGALGEDEDDWDAFKAKLPTYMNTKWGTIPFGIPLPGLNVGMKDSEDNVRVADIGYMIPWTPFIDAWQAYARKFQGKDKTESWVDPILNIGILNGPLPDIVTTLRTGIDPFTQRPVMDRYGSVPEQIGDVISYVARTALPTFITSYGVRGKLQQVLFGDNIDPRTGEKKLDGFEAALRGIGVNTVSPNVKNSIRSNIDYRKSIISKQKAHDNKEIRTLRSNGGSIQDLAGMLKKQRERMKIHKDVLRDYRKQVRG